MSRRKNLFDPSSKEPFKLSRSKLELFMSCPRCFYIDRRLGISQPGGLSFSLNDAVDTLLKREFDIYRKQGQPHPVMVEYNIQALPYEHALLDVWRNSRKGVQFCHPATNFLVYGAMDDLWITFDNRLIVVDYKAVSTSEEISLDIEYRQSYKRQVEIYQWLLRQNGVNVDDTAYFIFANGQKALSSFNNKLEFELQLIKYIGNAAWVEEAIINAYECLKGDTMPEASKNCVLCKYVDETKLL